MRASSQLSNGDGGAWIELIMSAADASDTGASVRSVDRALELLLQLELAGRPLRLSDVARLAAIHKATAQRLLLALERRGFVQRANGRFQVGAAVMPLAHAFLLGNNLARASLPILQELADASKETATLFIRLGLHRVPIQRVEGLHPLRYSLPLGQRLPLHLGPGRLLAAAMPKEELTRLLESLDEIRLSTGEGVTRGQFLEKLQDVREQGFLIAHSEHLFGVSSVSAPVLGPQGDVIAIMTVTGASDRLDDQKARDCVREVRRAAQTLTLVIASG
jgi:IclR family acetate operon transcriptional repressor